MTAASMALAGGAAVAGGFVNAIAGGGSLITFPALVALGLPAVAASATNTVAMCPGYLGATVAQRALLRGQRARMLRVLPVAALGGVGGALLLLATGEAAFGTIVPFLILLAALLLAGQDWIKRRLHAVTSRETLVAVPIGLAATYGGYFGAGMGVMVIAALAICIDDTLTRINALKQTISLTVNIAAAIVFALSPETRWAFVPAMMVGALLGGVLGGALANRIPAAPLRATIVVLGVVLSIVYFVRAFG